MAHSYCTESISEKLSFLGLPFPEQFARALVALLSGGKGSLQQVARRMPGFQSEDANRQQLRRCLDHETLTSESWARTIAALLPAEKWVLALDRTESHRGGALVNLLVLAVVINDSAVPLLWTAMPNVGTSDSAERTELLGRFVSLFGREKVRFLTADREFIGFDWIHYLLQKKIPFRIRIKAGMYLRHQDGTEKRAGEWFGLRACRCKAQKMDMGGLPVFVGGKRLMAKQNKTDKQYLIVISNEPSDLLVDYRLRWKIETLFQALKGRGFDMESCRLSEEKRLSGWFGFLALGFCWCLKIGRYLEQSSPIPRKKHGRRQESVFHRGHSLLQNLLSYLAGRPTQQGFDLSLEQLCPIN